MQHGPGTPEYEARMQADIARLNAAKGVQMGAWLRENKGVAIAFGLYLGVVAVVVGVGLLKGWELGPALLFGLFISPFVLLRIALRWSRIRQR